MSINVKIKPSKTLVIYCTRIRGRVPNNFFEDSGLINASKIIISDSTNRLSLGGFPPEYPTFFDFVNHLKQLIQSISHKKLIVTGNSFGASMALVFGHLLNANYVVAFAPYSYFIKEKLVKTGDPALKNWKKLIVMFENLPLREKKFLNLREILSNWNGKTRYYVHSSYYHKWDRRRAKYLIGLPKMSVFLHPNASHNCALFHCQA
jgi:hypothetical protein